MPCNIHSVNYTNISNRLRLRGDAPSSTGSESDATVLSLENGRHGLCLRVRKTSTAARRKLGACKIALAAVALSAAGFAHQVSAQIYTIQPTTEATSKDAKIYDSASTQNFQSNLDVSSPDVGASFSSLVQFSLSTVPAAPAITQATLTLYCRGLGATAGAPGAGAGTVSIRPITSGWSETAADAAVAGAPPLATYNAFFGATPTITLGNVVASSVVNGAGFVTWDITSLAQQWQAGTLANNGVYLFTAAGDIGFDDVDTLTVANSSPSLTVTVPEPSTTAAMALGGVVLLLAGRRLRRRDTQAA